MNHHQQSMFHIWNQLRVDDCVQCDLHKDASTVCLLGDGPVPARGMIIGDAPSTREDATEIPFSGKSGIFLRRSLKEIGIDPRDLYFAYTTSCRPPANRDPKTSEMKTCSSLYLRPQIDKVKPDVILLLGNGALQWAKGKKGAITKEEGSTLQWNGITCVPSRQPSSVLRMEEIDRREYLYALAKFKANLFRFKKLLYPEQETFKFVQNWDPIFKSKAGTPVYTDIEANGINPFMKGSKIHCIGACVTADNVMSRGPLNDTDTHRIQWMLKHHPIMSQGGTFEGTWFYHHYGVEPLIWYDTRLGYFVQDENVPYDLKNRAVRMLGVEPWDDEQDFQNPNFPVMLPYNAKDNAYGLRLFREHDIPFFKKNPRVAKLMRYILCPAEEVFIKVICRGVHINVKEGKKRIQKCAAEKKRLNDLLNEAAGYKLNPGSSKQMSKFFYDQLKFVCPVFTKGGKKGKPQPSTAEAALIRLKLRYDNPVIDALWEWRGWAKNESTYLLPWTTRGPINHFNYGFTNTDTGRLNSTSVKDFRGQKKALVSCPFCVVDKIDPNCQWCGKHIKKNKKLPPGMMNVGLGATAHQCPRDPFIRSLVSPRGYAPEFDVVNGKWVKPKQPFILPDEWCILEADLSQIELRLVAHASGDETMCRIFNEGGDIHYETARELQPVGEIDKETRKKAKAVNFGFVYGMWWRKFIIYCLEKFDLKLRPREGKLYREKFFNKYDGLLPWHRRVEAFVTQNGHIDSVFGRRRHLPSAMMPTSDDCPDCLKRGHIEKDCFFCGGEGLIHYGETEEWIRKEAIRQGINSPIQSAGSDLNLFIAGLMQARSYHETIIKDYPMTKWGFKIDEKRAFMVASAHDSQIYECRKDYVKELRDGIKYTVKNLPISKFFGFEFRVPIEMDCTAYSDCWKGTLMEIS